MRRLAVLMNLKEIDNLIRLQILEGALGKQPRYWRGDWRRGFREVAQMVRKGEVAIDPSWYTPGSLLLAKSVEQAVHHIAGKSLDSRAADSVDDIVLNFVMGISAETGNLTPKPKLYWAGEQKASLVLDKGATPESFVNIVKETTRQFATNAVVGFNRLKRQVPVSLDTNPSDDEDSNRFSPSTSQGLGSKDQFEVLIEVLESGGRSGAEVRNWMLGVAERISPQMVETVRTYLDMVREYSNVTNRMVAQALGKTEQAVGQSLNRWTSEIRRMELPSRIQNTIELAADASALGYHGLRAASKRKESQDRINRIASRVAANWLASRV